MQYLPKKGLTTFVSDTIYERPLPKKKTFKA